MRRNRCSRCKQAIHDDPTEDCRQILSAWRQFADRVSDAPVGRSLDFMASVDGVTDDLEDVMSLLDKGTKRDEASAVNIMDMAIDTTRDEISHHLNRERQDTLARQAVVLLARMEQLKDDLAARNRLR